MKILDLPEVTSVEDDQVLIVDGGGLPTSKIKAKNLNLGSSGGGDIIANPEDQWIYHRNTYRGKFLGTVYTDEQKAAVSAGTFDDLYIGDYWTIGGFDWIIADINYWLGTGDTECTTPHLVVVPKKSLYNAQMNIVESTGEGYVNSTMRTQNLNNAKTIIYTTFGENNILNHRESFINSVANQAPNGSIFIDSKVDLMNQIMLYGSYVVYSTAGTNYIHNDYTIDKTQLSLFRLNTNLIADPENSYWLRDIVSATSYAYLYYGGSSNYHGSTYSYGVRPVFGLTG